MSVIDWGTALYRILKTRNRESDSQAPDLRNADLRNADLRNADLQGVNLSGANLSGVDLSKANLSGADLSSANLYKIQLNGADLHKANLTGADLREADLRNTDLGGADLGEVNLSGANLSEAYLSESDLNGADLSGAYLRKANLSGAYLHQANLNGASLHKVNLNEADLSRAVLYKANLSEADLIRVQALGSNFSKAIFTASCLEDWNINSATKFDGATSEYVYLKSHREDRRPREGSFKSGEFAALFQQAVDTVDLIFKDGIDWQAFFQSFQDLRKQYSNQDLTIQAIERKRGGAFVVRVEVPEDIDKAAVEEKAKALYEEQLNQIEGHYQKLLQLQGYQLNDYRSQVRKHQQQNSRLIGIVETMAEKESVSKYDLRGAQFGGGYVAGNVEGNQYGGIINNYGSNAEDITRLLTALRDQAQAFPTEQKDDANDALDLLERDLAEEQPDQDRIGRRLKKLVALGAAIGTIASGAAAVTGDVSTFTGNVIELTEQLGIPVEQVQLPPSGTL